eukprot:35371-Eustigmatos_ZCMA.PRE.1
MQRVTSVYRHILSAALDAAGGSTSCGRTDHVSVEAFGQRSAPQVRDARPRIVDDVDLDHLWRRGEAILKELWAPNRVEDLD